MKLLEKLGAAFDCLNRCLLGFLSAVVAFDFLVIVYDVVARYFFNAPTAWAVEMTEYSLLYITFLGAAYVQREEKHITVDLYRNLSPGLVRSVDILISLLCTVMSLILFWYGTKLFWNVFRSGIENPDSMLNIPQHPIVVVIPLGSLLLLIQFLRKGARHIGMLDSFGKQKGAHLRK